jgi:hypothetical protein
MSRDSIRLLAGACLSVCAGATFAAEPQPELAGPHIFMTGPHGETRVYAMKDFGGDQAERLRTLLQLRPEQEPALAAYLQALKPPKARRDSIRAGADTLSRLDAMEKLLDEDRAAGKARLDATRAFYGALDPRQKKVFDELPHLVMAAAWTLPLPPMPPIPPAQVMRDFAVPAFPGAFDTPLAPQAESPSI